MNPSSPNRVSPPFSLKSKKKICRWPELPGDIIGRVIKCLNCMCDITRFGMTCTALNSSIRKAVSDDIPATSPYLTVMVSNKICLHCTNEDAFYSRNDCEALANKRCIGSTGSWIVLLNLDTLHPFLFEPFKGKMISVPTIKNLLCEENLRHRLYMRVNPVRKAILTSDPAFSQNRPCHIVLLYQRSQKIGIIKMNLEAWADSRNEETASWHVINTGNRYLDILAHEEKVFALTDGYSIHIWNLKDKFNISTIMPTERPYFTTVPKDNHVYLLWHNNSFWTISRYMDYIPEYTHLGVETRYYRTNNFKVHKLCEDSKQWRLQNSVDGSLIFIGLNQTKALEANRNPIIAKNTILFADDNFSDPIIFPAAMPVDTGMFTLTEGKARPLPTKRSSEIQARPLLIKRWNDIQPTIWLFPSGF